MSLAYDMSNVKKYGTLGELLLTFQEPTIRKKLQVADDLPVFMSSDAEGNAIHPWVSWLVQDMVVNGETKRAILLVPGDEYVEERWS